MTFKIEDSFLSLRHPSTCPSLGDLFSSHQSNNDSRLRKERRMSNGRTGRSGSPRGCCAAQTVDGRAKKATSISNGATLWAILTHPLKSRKTGLDTDVTFDASSCHVRRRSGTSDGDEGDGDEDGVEEAHVVDEVWWCARFRASAWDAWRRAGALLTLRGSSRWVRAGSL